MQPTWRLDSEKLISPKRRVAKVPLTLLFVPNRKYIAGVDIITRRDAWKILEKWKKLSCKTQVEIVAICNGNYDFSFYKTKNVSENLLTNNIGIHCQKLENNSIAPWQNSLSQFRFTDMIWHDSQLRPFFFTSQIHCILRQHCGE